VLVPLSKPFIKAFTPEILMDDEADSQVVEEVAEESFDMDAAQESISSDLFGKPEETDEEIDLDQDIEEIEEETEEVEAKEDKEEVEKVEEKEEVRETRKAPSSWKKEMREFYASADPMLQDYIEQREEQMKSGLEQDRSDSNLGRTFRDIVTPYNDIFQQTGIAPTQAVQYLLNAHKSLSTGTIEQKQAAMQQLEQSYGITKPNEGSNPQITSLSQRLAQMEQNQIVNAQTARQAAQDKIEAAQAKIETEVDTFAKDHPLLDDLQDEIAGFIKQGYELEEAYNRAERSSDGYIQAEVDRQIKEREAEAESQRQEELKLVKKAKSVNVRGRNTSKAPTGPLGTMEDTMHETYREIQSRN
jgi:hypothetical protein